MKKIDETNFFLNTRGKFRLVKGSPNREPDYISYDRWGDVSSKYWYTSKGVYRESSHWSRLHNIEKPYYYYIGDVGCCYRVATCYWTIHSKTNKYILNERAETLTGFCSWKSFKYNNVRRHGFGQA